MPTVSTAPLFNKVVPVTKSHVMAPDETFASIKTMPAGGLTIFLPGPTAPVPPGAQPVPDPGNGDYYEVADPHGLISGGNPLTVDGGGFRIGVSGHPLSINGVGAFGGGHFTFDNDAQLWIFCSCGWQFPD
jgi:hypothetical protein